MLKNVQVFKVLVSLQGEVNFLSPPQLSSCFSLEGTSDSVKCSDSLITFTSAGELLEHVFELKHKYSCLEQSNCLKLSAESEVVLSQQAESSLKHAYGLHHCSMQALCFTLKKLYATLILVYCELPFISEGIDVKRC